MSAFLLGSLAAAALVAILGASLRSRTYAVFRLVTLSIHALLASAMFRHFAALAPLYLYLHVVVYLHSLSLIRPAMRPLWYRLLVSIPSSFFSAGTMLSLPWAVLSAFGFDPWLPWLPYLVAALGVFQSLWAREEEVDIVVRDGSVEGGPVRHRSSGQRSARPLRIVQITDPHLGPFMSVARLQRIAARAVERQPDLVFLTGDFLTMESQRDPELLTAAFAPLAALRGRVFACFGNHDHEAPDTVKQALASAGVTLLMDEATLCPTELGTVQILGMDFHWRGRKDRMRVVCEKHPREPGALRIVLLHDPGAFKHLPAGEADLVLSGHTHGGQVGLVSLGLPYTMLRLLMNAPDHGLWARGPDRLYVHRGTGHYGFPLRVGVPSEESLVRVHALGFEPAE